MPRVGIMVTKIDFQELKEVYRCRILIEGEVGKLVAKNITDAQLSEMRRLLDVCRKIKENGTREKLVKLDREFRKILFQAANSRPLQEISDLLYNQTLRVWHLTFDSTDILSEVNMEAGEIEETMIALSKRDPDIARELRSEVVMEWVARSYKFFTSY
jgi:DNA-binding GntR family transcriptional regulator